MSIKEKPPDDFFKGIIKQCAGKKLGYNYEIWVYNPNGKQIKCYK